MELSSVTSANSTQSTSNADVLRDTTSDFETFLKLLTTQLKNQDPLKPLESTDFVAQLANFSGVEQQVRTNEALEEMKSLLGQSSASGLATWIGAEVRAERPLTFDGTPVDIVTTPARGADKAELVVTNAAGDEVQRTPVPLAPGTYEWAAADADGQPLADGTYTLKLESFRNDEVLNSAAVPIFGTVSEARLEDGAVRLVLSDGTDIAAEDVGAIRAAGS